MMNLGCELHDVITIFDPNQIGYIIIIRTKELHILQNDTHCYIKPNPNMVTFVTLAPTCPNDSFPILSPKMKCQQCDPKNDPIQWLRMVSSGGYMYYELIPIISPNWSVSTLPAWQHYQQTNSYGTSIMKVDHFQGKQTMYYLWKIIYYSQSMEKNVPNHQPDHVLPWLCV